MTKSNGSQTSRLALVKREKLADPLRFLFYSVEGVGKSTLAKHAPDPIFLDIEDGTGRLEIARYPFGDGPGAHVPQGYADVLSALEDLRTGEHEFKTLVIDTIDRLEALMWAAICDHYSGKRDEAFNKSGRQIASLESFGYGKGYNVALDWWRVLCGKLDALRRHRGMQIVLLGHTTIRTFKNPSGEDFDRYQPRIHDKASGFLREWCDVVGFCAFEDGAKKMSDDDRKAKGYTTGRRLIHLERSAAFDAKTRIPLPAEVELSPDDPWAPLAAAIEEGRNASPDDLVKLIDAELARIGDEALAKKVDTSVKGANGDTAELSRFLNRLRARAACNQEAA
jgi:hypothetical protein